jgi:hypothetical protein
MKQNITVDDINQLTEEQKEKLRDMWRPDFLTPYFNYKDCLYGIVKDYYSDNTIRELQTSSIDNKKDCLPLLSIAQMIEILNKRKKIDADFEIHIATTGYTQLGLVCDDYNNKIWFEGKELCNVLFEAVKSIL